MSILRTVRWLIVVLCVGSLHETFCCTVCADYEIDRSIEYKILKDGSKLLTDVYLPARTQSPTSASHESPSKSFPTLLMIHGGAWFSGNKVHVSQHARYAASQGFAVVAINYRLAPRYKFPAQVEDCLDALAWISSQADKYGFDLDRVAVYGYSAGAHLATLVGMRQNASPPAHEIPSPIPNIRAIVAGGSPCEFSWIPDDAKTLAYWLGDSRKAVPDVYQAATPLGFVDKGDPPTFLFHGDSDRIVPRQSSEKMAERLKNAHVPYQLRIIKDATHIGAFLDEPSREKAILFLKRHLK